MGLDTVNILGINISTAPKNKVLEEVRKYLENSPKEGQKSLVIVTPNPEQIMLASKDKQFAQLLNRADVAIPDGIGVIWANGILGGKRISERITGVEFMENLVALAANRHVPIGLIGGMDGVAVKALERLRGTYKGLVGWALEPEGKTVEEIADKIKKTGVMIVFVGLGAPKQELFIERLSAALANQSKISVFMAVGGAFDEISGKLPRSPHMVDASGFKWLWRLVVEPWRWKRQLSLLSFSRAILKEKIGY